MSFNWSSIGSAVQSALTAAGASAGTVTATLSALFAAQNPNKTEELSICAQILIASDEPALVAILAPKLAAETGIPVAAAHIALQLSQPGVDVAGKVLQIETIIKNGG